MVKKIKNLIFDLDNTLYDFSTIWKKSNKRYGEDLTMIKDIIINLIVAFITYLSATIFHNRLRIKIWLQSILRWNKDIRLSCAYLFQIKQNGKYLLIKGNRIEQYQPVGGVYKYYNSFNEVKSKLELKDESERHFYENGDLRLITKGRYLVKFLVYKQKIFNIYEAKIPSDIINIVLSSDRYCLV